jgi:hypothetical protein
VRKAITWLVLHSCKLAIQAIGLNVVTIVATTADGDKSSTVSGGTGNGYAMDFQAGHLHKLADRLLADRARFEMIRRVEMGVEP